MIHEHEKVQVDSTQALFDEGKRFMRHLFQESAKTIGVEEELFEHYKKNLVDKVQEKPLASILIAGGVGFLLARWLKR